MRITFALIFFAIVNAAFGQSLMKVNSNAKQKLGAFIKKTKFEAEAGTAFNGLSSIKLKPNLTKLIDQSAKDFLTTVNNGPTEAKFQKNIRVGLERFNVYYLDLDTEDRERICRYFEELMDCVGLQSSNGQLNTWMYGFDPTKKG